MFALVRPGAIVKKITFKKSIDILRKIIIIISVKGRDRGTETTVWKAETLWFD